jgi:hypothetical protein
MRLEFSLHKAPFCAGMEWSMVIVATLLCLIPMDTSPQIKSGHNSKTELCFMFSLKVQSGIRRQQTNKINSISLDWKWQKRYNEIKHSIHSNIQRNHGILKNKPNKNIQSF